MTQQPDMSEMDEYYERTRRPLFKRPQTPLGKLGCNLLIVGWFLVLLLPITMVWLAFGNTITIPRNNIPEAELHPRLQIQLIMSVENRGLQISRSNVQRTDETNLCVENQRSYLLWEDDGSALPATYCQCYQRADAQSEWVFTRQIENTCENSQNP